MEIRNGKLRLSQDDIENIIAQRIKEIQDKLDESSSLCQPAKIKFCLLIKHLNGLKLAALRQQPCLDGAMVGKILFLNAGRQKLRWGKLPDRALGQWPSR